MNLLKYWKTLALVSGLALWYNFNDFSHDKISSFQRYPLPSEIKVAGTTLPYETRNGKFGLEKIVKTEDIDFSKDFEIETERYHLVKDNDWLPSRLVGHVFSVPAKLIFWDSDFGWGLDEEKSRAVLSMLEKNKDLKDLTIRINHNEAFYDWYRMMFNDVLRERNPFLYRLGIGTFGTLGSEVWGEFFRGDYYNPLTKTVVLYSNIEAISAHELGHHKDFSRFDTDWLYSLSKFIPFVVLNHEGRASLNAKEIMAKEDEWQFDRYLIPAFFTYALGSIPLAKKYYDFF
ncbi:MAG: hypothetical protein AABX93_03030 [Nanoarchaeota archaeon]